MRKEFTYQFLRLSSPNRQTRSFCRLTAGFAVQNSLRRARPVSDTGLHERQKRRRVCVLDSVLRDGGNFLAEQPWQLIGGQRSAEKKALNVRAAMVAYRHELGFALDALGRRLHTEVST